MSALATVPKIERLLYHLVVTQGPRVKGRVFLNDLPAYEEEATPNHCSIAGRCNNLLVPGRNTLRIEVDRMGDESDSIFFAQILRDPDEAQDAVRVHELKWPHATAELPEPLPTPVPFVWENEFTIEEDHPPPFWAKNEPEQIPRGGTPELVAKVKEFHDALVMRDAAKMTDLTWWEAQDSARYYPHLPPPSKGTIASTYAGGFDQPWVVNDWDPDRLLFTPRAGGRLVHVTGLDGKHAIHGQHTKRPDAIFLLNPLLVRSEGKWELYR